MVTSKNEKFKALKLVVFSTFITSTGQFLQKLGLNILKPAIQENVFANILQGGFITVLGIGLYFIAFVLIVIAMSKADLSMVYPFIGLSFVWVALLSKFFLNEHLPLIRVLGIGLIVSGLFFISKT
ncbi:EamA family transporter [Candidatus Woesearchaeota archaeon]|nr:EamA family transporter [Candidatus Woesearchaeota archaeon]